jgi:hypothetical protein
MSNKKKLYKLLDAVKPFISSDMMKYLSHWPDDTTIRISAVGRDGYTKVITLKELRALWETYREVKGE